MLLDYKMEKSLTQIQSEINGQITPQYMLSVTHSQTKDELTNASNFMIK